MIQRTYRKMRGRAFSKLPIACCALFILILSLPLSAWARVGGGQSYGGGGDGGGSDDGGAIALIYLLFQIVRFLVWLTIEYPLIGIPLDILFIVGLYFVFRGKKKVEARDFSTSTTKSGGSIRGLTAAFENRRRNFAQEFDQLRRFDPNFSEIIFTDFCYALYARAHEARPARQQLDLLSPYLSDEARHSLLQRNPPNLKAVMGVIVGAMSIVDVRGLSTPMVNVSLEFEANYTEVVLMSEGEQNQTSSYVRERWELERRRDVLSPRPEQAVALHCPRCGAALEKDVKGACAFCGARITSGEFQWFTRSIAVLSREARGPLLTSDVPEAGTDSESIVQQGFEHLRLGFERANPGFNWREFETKVRLIFNELQAAWSTLEWERARPHETDNIFQMHLYWIEAYKRQNLRNILDQCRINRVQFVKIKEDAFYHSITARIWAEGYDYTVDQAGNVVSGSKSNLRRWSEYWTFIRHRKAQGRHARTSLACPNCGAPLNVNAAGVCQFCGGKVTSGEFDWVLSKIEQDESYMG